MKRDGLTSTARHVATVKKYGMWGRGVQPAQPGALAAKTDLKPRLARKGGR